MSAQILDGKRIAGELIDAVAQQVTQRISRGLMPPGLAMLLVGDNPASTVYVRNKERACERCGFHSILERLPVETSQAELLDSVDALNQDPSIHGILVQLPLPDHIDSQAILRHIDPDKDADGFHPINMGRLALGLPGLRPCTPRGIMTLLQNTGIDLDGKDALVIGRSNIVGRPMALELLRANATVTVTHSHTRDLAEKAAQADILVAAIGRAQMVPGNWIKPGAVVIDVGMNRLDDGKLVGDVEFESACRKAAWITPVPGGVGPMTVASLLQNTLDAAAMLDP